MINFKYWKIIFIILILYYLYYTQGTDNKYEYQKNHIRKFWEKLTENVTGGSSNEIQIGHLLTYFLENAVNFCTVLCLLHLVFSYWWWQWGNVNTVFNKALKKIPMHVGFDLSALLPENVFLIFRQLDL